MNDQQRQKVLVTLATLSWVTVVIVAYYVIHKPFRAANLLALGRGLAGLAQAALTVALGTGIGLTLLSKAQLSAAERPVWAASLGLGVVSLTTLALGSAGLLHPWLLWALTLIGVATTAQTVWSALQEARLDRTWRPDGRFESFLAVYCCAALLIGLIWALTPPTAWDGLVYHLAGPKLYLAASRVIHPIDLPYLGFPQSIEMLFTWTMGLGGETGPASVHWFYGLLSVLVLVIAGRHWSHGSGWLAAAVLLSARTIVLLLGWPYVDLALLVHATLAFLALDRWAGQNGRTWLALSGVMAGLALSTKYTALALLPALGLALFAFRVTRGQPVGAGLRSATRDSLALSTVALLVWSPWLAKNLALTGNPTYPFFFDGIHWDRWRAWWYDRPGTGLAYTKPLRLLSAPWDATVWGVEGGLGYAATVGPLLLALLPLLLVVWRRLSPVTRRTLRAAAVFCGAIYAFWLVGVARTALLRQTRLLLPAFGILALMVGTAVDGLRDRDRQPVDLGWIIRASVALVLMLTLTRTLLFTLREQPLRVLLGFESREDFLGRRLGWYYPAIEYVNGELPQDSTILFLWEPRSYHCAADCRPDALLDRWVHTTYLHGQDAAAIAEAWRAEGTTHVLLHRVGYKSVVEGGFDPVTREDQRTLEDLLEKEATHLADFGGAYELYSLVEEQRP